MRRAGNWVVVGISLTVLCVSGLAVHARVFDDVEAVPRKVAQAELAQAEVAPAKGAPEHLTLAAPELEGLLDRSEQSRMFDGIAYEGAAEPLGATPLSGYDLAQVQTPERDRPKFGWLSADGEYQGETLPL